MESSQFVLIFVKTPKVSQESPVRWGQAHQCCLCHFGLNPSRLAPSIIEYGLDQYFTSSMYVHALLCIYRLFKNIFAEISEKMTCQLGHLPLKNRGDSSGLNLWNQVQPTFEGSPFESTEHSSGLHWRERNEASVCWHAVRQNLGAKNMGLIAIAWLKFRMQIVLVPLRILWVELIDLSIYV